MQRRTININKAFCNNRNHRGLSYLNKNFLFINKNKQRVQKRRKEHCKYFIINTIATMLAVTSCL